MKPATLYHYILPFVLSILWLTPYATKATQEHTTNIEGLVRTPKTNTTTWYEYPCSIQLRSGSIVHLSDEKTLILIPTMIDLDLLYVHPFFARQFDVYPRIGLSFLLPYTFEKEKQLRFPNLWAILGYIELYQSNTNLVTWGHRISIGGVKNGTLVRTPIKPNYSLLVTHEITYHWLFSRCWQLNLGIGVLLNWWVKVMETRPNTNHPTKANEHKLDGNMQKLIHRNNTDNDSNVVKLAPLATIGIRYITHTKTFFKIGAPLIYSTKQNNSRVDCSLMVNTRWLPATEKNYLIFRGATSLSCPINSHNGLIFALQLGHNRYTKALLDNMFATDGIELITLLGYEIRYGRCLLQLQLGYEVTDSKKLTIQNDDENSISNIWNKRGSISIHLQYMVTDYFFVGIFTKLQEQPGLRLGVSF